MTPAARRSRGFLTWLFAATASTLGDSITGFALAWVAAGHGAGAAGTVLTIEAIPLCVLILLGGVIADRVGIRVVMLGCDAAMAIVMGVFAAVAGRDPAVWLLSLVGLLSGTAAALRRPAAGAFPRLFTAGTGRELTRLTAMVSTGVQLARTAGPSIGGLLLAAGGIQTTSALDAASFVLVGFVLARVRPPHHPPPTPRGPAWRGACDAMRAARYTPGVPAALATVTLLAGAVLPLVSLLVPVAGRDRHWGAGETGAVEAAWLLGGLLTTATVVRRAQIPGPVAVAGPLLGAAGVGLVATTRSVWISGCAIGLVGVGVSLLTAWIFPRFVASTPLGMLARFQALLGLAQTGPTLVALTFLSALATTVGVTGPLIIVGLLLLATAATAARTAARLTPAQNQPATA